MHPTSTAPRIVLHPYDEAEEAPNTPAKICAEVAARLVEWGEVASRGAVSHWLSTLHSIYSQDHAAMWLYLAWQTGDTSRIAASFEDRGAATALPKQAVQQSTVRAFAAIAAVCPDLAVAMRETFEAHAPEAKHAASIASHSLPRKQKGI